MAGPQQRIGVRQRVDEAGADGLQVEGESAGDAEAVLHRHGSGGKGLVRRRGGQNDEVDVPGLKPGVFNGRAGGVRRQMGGVFSLGGDMAGSDTGALADPRIAGGHHGFQFGIGHHARRQIRAGAAHHRSATIHEAISPATFKLMPWSRR